MASKSEIVSALDAKLRLSDFSDYSNNGIQVDSQKSEITRVCSGVDASLPFFEKAAEMGADLVICHHGLSWGDSLKYIRGLNYELVSFLVRHDIALYAAHLPLDAHAELGNNAQIAAALGLRDLKPFGIYHGQAIGFQGSLPEPLQRDAFEVLLRLSLNPGEFRALPFGRDTVQTVGVVSGGAADSVGQAIDAGLDAYVTGEADLVAYNTALQRHMNMYAAGHYATERFGVRALGEWLASTFGVPHTFVDLNLPY